MGAGGGVCPPHQDIWLWLKHFHLSQLEEYYWNLVGRDPADIPQETGQSPTTKNYLLIVLRLRNSAKEENTGAMRPLGKILRGEKE